MLRIRSARRSESSPVGRWRARGKRSCSSSVSRRGLLDSDVPVYDRGNPSQVISPHQPVEPKVYTAAKVKLPAPDEIPGVDMQVQNYHVPPVGTFHAKYMVVDRKVALLNSNNIQDRVSDR